MKFNAWAMIQNFASEKREKLFLILKLLARANTTEQKYLWHLICRTMVELKQAASITKHGVWSTTGRNQAEMQRCRQEFS